MDGGDQIFVTSNPQNGHQVVIGGMTVLERHLREGGRAGIRRATISAAPVSLPADLPVQVTWVEPGTPPPEGAKVVAGHVCADVPIEDEASRLRAEWALCK